MSKIGKKPIIIPEDVQVKMADDFIILENQKGELKVKILPGVKAEFKENILIFNAEKKDKQTRSNWGTLRSLVQNAVDGLTKNFIKTLQMEGIGYRVTKENNFLTFYLGYSHPVKFQIPSGIQTEVEKNFIKISGIDKALVGQTAASIRALKKPEPYQGKGIKYQNEIIRKKAGKKVAGTGGKI